MIHSNCGIWVSATELYKLEVVSMDVSTIGRDMVNILSVAIGSLKDEAYRIFKRGKTVQYNQKWYHCAFGLWRFLMK